MKNQEYIDLEIFLTLYNYYFFPNLPQPFSFPFLPSEKETANALCVCTLPFVTWTCVSEA